MWWFFEKKQIPLETNTELSHKVQELKMRIDTLRKQIENNDYVQKITQENTHSMGSGEEKESAKIRVEDASQDFEKERKRKELEDIKSKLLRRKT